MCWKDVRDVPRERRDAEVERLARRAISQPFALASEPLWRALLIRVEDDRHELCLVGHHLVFDAWSQRIALTELAECYRAACLGVEPDLALLETTPFDFAVDERRRLASGELDAQIAYWIDDFQDAPLSLDIPTDRPGGPDSACPGRVARFTIPAPLAAQAHARAAAEGATLFSVMFAAYLAWLHHVSGSTDLWAAVPVANRARARWKPIVGCLAQEIRLRVQAADDPAFAELIARSQRAVRRGLRRQDVPLHVVDQRLYADRRKSTASGTASSTLIQPGFAFQDAIAPAIEAAGVWFAPEMRFDLLDVARAPILWQFAVRGSDIYAFLEYRTDLFDRDTADRWIADFLRILDTGTANPEQRLSAIAPPRTRAVLAARAPRDTREPIAIAGIGCRFPGGADGPERFWKLLQSGGDAVTEIPPDRWSLDRFQSDDQSRSGKTYARHGAFLEHVDRFDAQFFAIAPREAARMDPQQRLLLEVAWEALEDAGIPLDRVAGAPVGVFVAAAVPDLAGLALDRDSLGNLDSHSASGISMSLISNRISYAFDLRGPSLTVDTACSGSLVAINQACQAIWSGTCETALAGGVQLNFMPGPFIMYSKATMLSPTGRCRAFDAGADGFVRGEGAGLVVLKRLSDAERDGDRVYAVIRGVAVNQDGRTPSLTMPSFDAQVAAIRSALDQADVPPHLVQFVEAHGPGTQAGDPIEAHALGATLAGGRQEPLAVGSVKTNIGHLESAAGVAGVIKLALSLWHRQIPPTLHFREPNPRIPMRELRLRVVTGIEEWPANAGGAPRAGAVNSFGFGGTNAHAVLTEASAQPAREGGPGAASKAELLVLSARSEAALAELARTTAEYLDATSDRLADIAYTGARRRSRLRHRVAIAGGSRAEMAAMAAACARGSAQQGLVSGRAPEGGAPRGPVFVFSGMGQQRAGMGRELFAGEPVFRAEVEACDRALRPHIDWSVCHAIAAGGGVDVDRTDVAQVSIFALQAGIAALLRSWGVEPEAIVGHSVGEVAAAYVSGALDLDDAAAVIAARSQLQSEAAGLGGMLAAGLGEDDLQARFPFDTGVVSVAARNSPRSVTLAGDTAELQRLSARLTGAGVFNRVLNVEVPYHSPAMAPLMPRLVERLRGIRPRPTAIRLVSTVTGEALAGTELDGHYWADNMRATVRFEEALRSLREDGSRCFVEIGAHPVLGAALRENAGSQGAVVASLRRDRRERAALLTAIGELFVSGHAVDLSRLYPSGSIARLPGHPWQRTAHWIEGEQMRRFRVEDAAHPLLGLPVPLPVPAWRSTIDLDRMPFLRDHAIRGDVVFPWTAYCEMAVAASRELFPGAMRLPADLKVDAPLLLRAGEETTLYTIASADRTTFAVSSYAGGRFTRHFSGRFEGSPAPAPALDIDAIRVRCAARIDGDEVYRRLRERGYEYGPACRGIRHAWLGDGEALFEVAWPDSLPEQTPFFAHPAVQDAYLNGAPLLAPRPVLWIPIGADEIQWFDATPRRGWGYVRTFAHTATTFAEHSDIADADGRITSRIRHFTFRAVDARESRRAPRDLAYHTRWEQVPLETTAPVQDTVWAIAGGRDGAGERLASRLRASGARVSLAARSTGITADPVSRVVYLALNRSSEAPDAALEDECLDLIRAVQTIQSRDPAVTLCVVTRGACRIDDEPVSVMPPFALWGLGRVVANEYPALRGRLIDVGHDEAVDGDALLAELSSGDAETEVALRNGRRWVPRITRAALSRPAGDAPYHLAIRTPGLIESLEFVDGGTRDPGPDDVRIAVEAAGLNFKDVVKTLGLIDGESLQRIRGGQSLGGECAGRVVAAGANVTEFRPGDDVIAIAAPCFGPFAFADARYVAAKPAGITFEAAATLPIAYLTAYAVICDAARARAGERILIHSATGGVGQAAIAIARALDLEVFATAGSEAKRALLRQQGVAHVMDSRSTAFADETLAATGGAGVDIVLNTLPASTLPRSIAVLRPRGRLVDIANIYTGGSVDLRAFQKGLTVTAFDLDQLMRTDPDAVAAMFRAAMRLVNDRGLAPVPHRAFPLGQAADAFRLMAQAQHVGKLVLVPEPAAPVRVDVSDTEGPRLRGDATYLVTGGTSGLGLATAAWLVERGARHVALVSRRGRVSDSDRATLDAMRPRGADVRLVSCDVARAGDLAAALRDLDASMPPLAGVVHAAAAYADATLAAVDADTFAKAWRAKVSGAWNLHVLTKGRALDFFVVYSSIAAWFGSAGQGVYAAANAFLDGLAEYRRSQGLPATAVAWSPIADIGEVARRAWLHDYFVEQGLPPLAPADAVRALGVLLRLDGPPASIMAVDWERRLPSGVPPRFSEFGGAASESAGRRSLASLVCDAASPEEQTALVADQIATAAAAVLRMPAEAVDRAVPMTSLGLDSLMAVELSARLHTDLEIDVSSVRLLAGPTVTELAAQLVPSLLDRRGAVADVGASRSESPDAFDLSPQQLPIWRLVHANPGHSLFNLAAAIRLRGPLDVPAFTRAIDGLVARHAMLRASIETAGGETTQRTPPLAFSLPLDVLSAGDRERDQALDERARAFALAPFDPAADPMFRARLLRLDAHDHALLISAHHLAADGASLPILLRDGLALYAAAAAAQPDPLPRPASTYADFVRWQRERLRGERRQDLIAQWTRVLGGRLPPLPLPLDRPRPAARSFRGGNAPIAIPAEIGTALARLGRSEQATLFASLMTALAVLVTRMTGLEDFCLGTFSANRARPEDRDVVGCYINQLPVRIDLHGDPSARTLLGRVRHAALDALALAELPFAMLASALAGESGEMPSLPVVLILHNEMGSLARYRTSLAALDVEFLEYDNDGAKRDWTFHLYESNGALSGRLEYDADVFTPAGAAAIVEAFARTVEAVALNPDAPARSIAAEVV